jgi:uncharacterized membrane protein
MSIKYTGCEDVEGIQVTQDRISDDFANTMMRLLALIGNTLTNRVIPTL